MSNDALNALDALDRLSGLDTPVHRLDARVKLLATLGFIVAVVSFGKYEIAGLVPFLLFPLLVVGLGNIPMGALLKRSAMALPVALGLAGLNPWLDPRPMPLGGWMVAAGWTSLAVVVLKSLLTASMALLLIATTSFPGICSSLERLGVPRLLTQQLLFLWRYMGVLTQESGRLTQARDQRSFGQRGRGWRVASRLIGVLLQRALERAERIHAAMLCRGFRGAMPSGRQQALGLADLGALALALAALLLFRFLPIADALGAWMLRGLA